MAASVSSAGGRRIGSVGANMLRTAGRGFIYWNRLDLQGCRTQPDRRSRISKGAMKLVRAEQIRRIITSQCWKSARSLRAIGVQQAHLDALRGIRLS